MKSSIIFTKINHSNVKSVARIPSGFRNPPGSQPYGHHAVHLQKNELWRLFKMPIPQMSLIDNCPKTVIHPPTPHPRPQLQNHLTTVTHCEHQDHGGIIIWSGKGG